MADSTNIKKNLLIIEGDENSCEEISSLLCNEYNIIRMADVREGETYLTENKVGASAVLLDADIPQVDMDAFLTFMKNHPSFSGVPILMLIGEECSEDVLKRLGHGIIDCIGKPYDQEIMKNRISNAIVLNDSMTFYGIEKMLKELPSNIYLKDSEARYVFATHYWHHLEHGDDPNWTIRGKTDVEIRKDRENAIEAMKADQRLIETGKGTSYTIEINADGIQEFFEIIKEPLFDDKGKVNGIIGLINNVTDYELLKRKLEAKVRTDELTGLYNRAYFFEYLQILQDTNQYPVAVISADCDGLKQVNDTYGHKAGDDYILRAVQLFQMVLPEETALFRMGGDEFIFILPSTSKEEAEGFVEQMRCKQTDFQVEERVLSVSFGISTISGSEDSVEACIAESDMNMYAEKRKKQ